MTCPYETKLWHLYYTCMYMSTVVEMQHENYSLTVDGMNKPRLQQISSTQWGLYTHIIIFKQLSLGLPLGLSSLERYRYQSKPIRKAKPKLALAAPALIWLQCQELLQGGHWGCSVAAQLQVFLREMGDLQQPPSDFFLWSHAMAKPR